MMKRYRFYRRIGCVPKGCNLEEYPQGEYCLYEDVPGWVSVEERLPDDRQIVDIWINNTRMIYVSWDQVNEYWYYYSDASSVKVKIMGKATHWRSIPEPPGDDDD